MKTKKEIKPFKMRVCEAESIKVRAVLLLKYDYREYGYEETDPFILVNSRAHENTIQSGWNESKFNSFDIPELTYSEFMKLYGEEEEIFTREDMKSAMTWAISIFHNRFSEWCEFETKNNLLDKYLSERTND